MCQNYKSETGCICGEKCRFRHVEAEERPSKKTKKGGAKGSVALSKESPKLGRVSQDSYPRKSFLREERRLGSKHAVNFSKSTWHQRKIRERRVHREESFKSVNLMSVVLARQNSGKDHMRRPCTKKDALAELRGIWRNIFPSSKMRTKLRFTLPLKPRVMPAPTSRRPEEREFVVDSGSGVPIHMM